MTNSKFHIGITSYDSDQGDLEHKLMVSGTRSGRNFEFKLKGNHLNAVALPLAPELFRDASDLEHTVSRDWHAALTEPERLKLMQAVLANYRTISKNHDDLKVAAVGVVDNPDPYADESKKHLLYVGRNMNIGASDVYKSCAEQNMAVAAENSLEGHMHRQRQTDMPEKPYLKEVYVMGGRFADASKPGDKGLPAVCPCGMCTDVLAKKMVPKGHVYVFPHTDGKAQLHVDALSEEFVDVKPGHIWKTTIENLNRDRFIKLDEEIAEWQKNSIDFIAKRIVGELRGEKGYEVHTPSDQELKKSTQNLKAGRSSIARLDIATHAGYIQLTKINEFMREQVVDILKDRVLRDEVPLNYPEVMHWLTTKVRTVRVAAVQTDKDGSYHVGYDSQTGRDKAYVTPEFTAIGTAVPKLGTQGIKNLWYMEFNPQAIARGELVTPSKDGLERLMKRMSKETNDITVVAIPPNTLVTANAKQMSQLVKQCTFSIKKLLPGGFSGSEQEKQAGLNSGGGGHSGESAGTKRGPGDRQYHHSSYVERILSESQPFSRGDNDGLSK